MVACRQQATGRLALVPLRQAGNTGPCLELPHQEQLGLQGRWPCHLVGAARQESSPLAQFQHLPARLLEAVAFSTLKLKPKNQSMKEDMVFRYFQTSYSNAVHPLCTCVPSRSHQRGSLFTSASFWDTPVGMLFIYMRIFGNSVSVMKT